MNIYIELLTSKTPNSSKDTDVSYLSQNDDVFEETLILLDAEADEIDVEFAESIKEVVFQTFLLG